MTQQTIAATATGTHPGMSVCRRYIRHDKQGLVVGGLASAHVDFFLSIHPDQLSEARYRVG